MGTQAKDPYFSPGRAQAILFGVLLVHVSAVAIPLIYSSLMDYFDPPVVVMKVGIADLPLGDSPDAGQPPPADTAAATEPEPALDLPPDPQKVDPLPDLPPPPPKVEQKKTDVAPPKTETKVTPPKTNPPKTETKNDPPKTETKNDPPKSTVLRSQDITISTKTQTVANNTNTSKPSSQPNTRLQNLNNEILKLAGKNGTKNPGLDGVPASEEMLAYYDQLNDAIRPQWNAVSPSSIELRDSSISNWPVIELSIAGDGRITRSAIVSQSGNKKIDDAVKVLLNKLKVVPVPPKKQATTIRVTLDIR